MEVRDCPFSDDDAAWRHGCLTGSHRQADPIQDGGYGVHGFGRRTVGPMFTDDGPGYEAFEHFLIGLQFCANGVQSLHDVRRLFRGDCQRWLNPQVSGWPGDSRD